MTNTRKFDLHKSGMKRNRKKCDSITLKVIDKDFFSIIIDTLYSSFSRSLVWISIEFFVHRNLSLTFAFQRSFVFSSPFVRLSHFFFLFCLLLELVLRANLLKFHFFHEKSISPQQKHQPFKAAHLTTIVIDSQYHHSNSPHPHFQ